MLELILGPCGTGKSRRIYSDIVGDLKDGKRVCLIVPEQMALYAERMINSLAGDVSELELEVLSFRRLADRVFRDYGGLSFNTISDAGKTLVMWRVLFGISPFLKQYDFSLGDNSLVDLMMNSVDVFRRNLVTPQMLDKASAKFREKNRILSEKLADMSLIYSTYVNFIKYQYDDASDELTRLAETLAKHDFFSQFNVYIDGFDDYVLQQYAIVEKIFGQAKSVRIAVSYDPDDKSGLFNSTERTYRSLLRIAERTKTEVKETRLTVRNEIESPVIRFVSENFWKHSAFLPSPENKGDIRMIECGSAFEECSFIASDIARKVRESGARYRDFAVILRDAASYESTLAPAFGSAGIPFFMSRRTDISERPVFRLILSALSVIKDGWKTEDVISYAKTSLTSVTRDECDMLENYALTWDISGKLWYTDADWNMNPRGLSDRMGEGEYELLEKLAGIRKKLTAPLLRLSGSLKDADVRTMTEALYAFLVENDVRTRISEKAKAFALTDSPELRDETVVVWNTLIKSLDSLVMLCGDMKIGVSDYYSMLRVYLSKINVGSIPVSVDQVLVGSSSTLRSGRKKHVYLCGVNEGVFPKNIEEGLIFSDNDLEALSAEGFFIEPTSDERSADELFAFYKCLSGASQTLTVTYPVSNLKGEGKKRSFAAARIDALLGGNTAVKYSDIPKTDLIEDKYSALREAGRDKNGALGRAALELLHDDPEAGGYIDAFGRSLSALNEKIGEDTAAKVYKNVVGTSYSRIETFAKCPFAHHASYILKLDPRARAEFIRTSAGNVIHKLLQEFITEHYLGKTPDVPPDDIAIEQTVDEFLGRYLKDIVKTEVKNFNKIKRQIMSLRKQLILILKNVVGEFENCDFVPKYCEFPVGYGEEKGVKPYELRLEDGRVIMIGGYVDRVDVYKKNGDLYFRVIDYKSGEIKFNLDSVEKGLGLQMLLYMMAIWKEKDSYLKKDNGIIDGKLIPAGVLFYQVQTANIEESKAPYGTEEDVIDELESGNFKRSGMSLNDDEIVKAMDKTEKKYYVKISHLKTLEELGELCESIDATLKRIGGEMVCGRAEATPGKQCEYCRYKPFCRVNGNETDQNGEEEEEAGDE